MLANTSKEISNSLKLKFLYNKDLNSIHLLINLYKSEDRIGNIYPQYMSLSDLRLRLKKHLNNREGKDLAAKNIAELIHDDINRFELLLYLESYKSGFKSNKYANGIEKIILNNIDVESIYSKNTVHQMISSIDAMKHLKDEVIFKFRQEMRTNDGFNKLIDSYVKRVIKPKLFNINDFLDRQVKMYENSDGNTILKYETKLFKKAELILLYKKIVSIISEDCIRVLADAYWTGLIEKVLRRYR